jgi:pyruvate kinase
MIQTVERLMQERNLAKPGDTIIITAGYPLAVAGRTNFLKLHTIGEYGYVLDSTAPNL